MKIAESGSRRAILFADVCDSTAIYETLGDTRALALVNRVFAMLAKKVKAARGAVVKTLGDGMVCQFASADAAFRAACEIQAGVKAMSTQRGKLAIKVGFNYGPVVPKGDDVFGDTVNVCSRLVERANKGQVLSTQQTVDGLSPGLRKRCRSLYTTKLRGRAEPVAVCEILWRSDPDVTEVNLTQETLARAAQWVLKVRYGGETFDLEPSGTLTVGRDKSNDIVVASHHASRQHARLFGREGHFVVADQSSNGTFVAVDGHSRELRLRSEEGVLGERGAIGLGNPAGGGGDHVLSYRIERRGGR